MAGDPQRTDYLPAHVYTDHAKWTIAHPPRNPFTKQQRLSALHVPFNAKFDIFAANVAFAIRRYVIYRTDGGMFARGLVRDVHTKNGLVAIHTFLLHAGTVDGTVIRLEAILYRRNDLDPTRRWSMTIEFGIAKTNVKMDEELIEIPSDNIDKSEQNFADKVLHITGLVAQEIRRKNPNQGDRLLAMVAIADRQGYPRLKELWYYGQQHVRVYLDYKNDDAFRKRLTAETGGKFPFDGFGMQGEGQRWDANGWRMFPFRSIFNLCRRTPDDLDRCHEAARNVLLAADSDMMANVDVANRTARFASVGDPRLWGPLVWKFYDHLVATQKSHDNLFSAYAQRPGASGLLNYLTGAN